MTQKIYLVLAFAVTCFANDQWSSLRFDLIPAKGSNSCIILFLPDTYLVDTNSSRCEFIAYIQEINKKRLRINYNVLNNASVETIKKLVGKFKRDRIIYKWPHRFDIDRSKLPYWGDNTRLNKIIQDQVLAKSKPNTIHSGDGIYIGISWGNLVFSSDFRSQSSDGWPLVKDMSDLIVNLVYLDIKNRKKRR